MDRIMVIIQGMILIGQLHINQQEIINGLLEDSNEF